MQTRSGRPELWPGRQLVRVAVEGAVVGERVRVVGGGALVGARAALVVAAGRGAGADPGPSERDRVAGQLGEVVLATGAVDDPIERGDRRHRVTGGGAKDVKERPEAVGDRLRGVDERVEVVEGRPQVD